MGHTILYIFSIYTGKEGIKNMREYIYRNCCYSILMAIFFTMTIKILSGIIFIKFLSNKSELFTINYYLYSCIFILIIIFLINRIYNKRSIKALGFRKGNILYYIKGILSGLGILFIILFLIRITHSIYVKINKNISWKMILILLIGFFIQSLTEEVLFRGYIQNHIAIYKGIPFAIIMQALIFSGVHILNAGNSILVFLNLFLIAIFLGLAYSSTNYICFSTGIHFIWNFLLAIVIKGKINDNMNSIPILYLDIMDNILSDSFLFLNKEILTGGDFGIEGSIFTTIVFTILIIYKYGYLTSTLWKKE